LTNEFCRHGGSIRSGSIAVRAKEAAVDCPSDRQSQLEYQERQKKDQAQEQEQKILPPAAPPSDSVPSAPFSSQPETAPTQGDRSPELNSVAVPQEVNSSGTSNTTNV